MIGKKLLITGSEGMLGSFLLDYFHTYNSVGFGKELDITDSVKITTILNNEKPDIIIHTAANTDLEFTESNPDIAYKVNTLGTQNLVNYCLDKDILLVYISSTGVYGDHKSEPYNELDDTFPTTIHHKSKFAAENIIRNHLNKFLILRTGWIYGGDISCAKNFVKKIIDESKMNKLILSDNSQIGCPTNIYDFAKQIEHLILEKQFGIFNCVCKAINISRCDYVSFILKFSENNSIVKVAPENYFKRVAPVSKNESAVNYKLELLNMNIMRNWKLALEDYMNEVKF